MKDQDIDSKVFAEIQKHIQSIPHSETAAPAPSQLFHYTSMAAFMQIAESGILRATNCLFLNDSKELVHIRSIIEKYYFSKYVGQAADFRLGQRVLEAFDGLLGAFGENVYVMSFSRDPDSLALWNGYSFDSACCMAFDLNSLLKIVVPPEIEPRTRMDGQGNTYHAFEVQYDESFQTKVVSAYLEIVGKYAALAGSGTMKNEVYVRAVGLVITELINFAICCKSSPFHTEQEYRLSFSLFPGHSSKVRYRSRKDLIIPYIEVDIRNASGLIPITEVWLGPRNSTPLAQKGVENFLRARGYAATPVRVSKASLRY